MGLDAGGFRKFFRAVHGCDPFPWQERLARQAVQTGEWPPLLDLPTAAGKTAVLDVAVFHLACEAGKAGRRAPVRIIYVVDRRVVVDAAFERARRISTRLEEATGGVLKEVADALRRLGGPNAPALDVVRLRGGMPQDRDWTRSPVQPLVVVSTVDQVGSRLLFRGYGVSERMRPVHAGLVGSDALWLLDEVHLSRPLEETLEAIVNLHGPHGWRRRAPFGLVKLTATPEKREPGAFRLRMADRNHPVLGKRLSASKLAMLDRYGSDSARSFADWALRFAGLADGGPPGGRVARRVGVVVNRVDLARRVFELLLEEAGDAAGVYLLTGRIRPLDRQRILEELAPFFAAPDRSQPEKPLILVATQTVEVGADLDFDALVTEIAPLDSLRQRFGRLDRLGLIGETRAVILGPSGKEERKKKTEIPPGRNWAALARLYGVAVVNTDDWLEQAGEEIDFGVSAMERRLASEDPAALEKLLAPRRSAPVVFPAYCERWWATSPEPEASPEPSLFLHGPGVSPEVRVVWRAGIDPEDVRAANLVLSLCPPSSLEEIALPLWVLRRWLGAGGDAAFADVPEALEESQPEGRGRAVLRWNPDREEWERVTASQVVPGDLVVVPASRGGCDGWGWAPDALGEVPDLGAAANYCQRLRGCLFACEATFRNALGEEGDREWRRLIREILELPDPEDGPEVCRLLLERNLPPGWRELVAAARDYRPRVTLLNPDDPGRGFVLHTGRALPPGLLPGVEVSGREAFTDREQPAGEVLLSDHLLQVEAWARFFALRAGLPGRLVRLVCLAARLHDLGKADPRCQADYRGVRLGNLPFWPGPLLAKSLTPLSGRRAVPAGYRHEAVSVALALAHPEVAGLPQEDRDLVAWLVGSHHGRGRPLFPACDYGPTEVRAELEGLAVSMRADEAPVRLDRGWPDLARRVYKAWGPWELARLEAILRLADHAASAGEVAPPTPQVWTGFVPVCAARPSEEVWTQELPGLEVDSLLGFLALLGLLRVLERSRPEWRPRLSFGGTPPRAILHLVCPASPEEVADAAAEGLVDLAVSYLCLPTKPWADTVEFRELAAGVGPDARRLLAALSSDAVLRSRSKKKTELALTPYCLMLGQGHQDFLGFMRDNMKVARDSAGAVARLIREALYEPWERGWENERATPDRMRIKAFRWDPVEERRHAYQAGDPTEENNKLGTVPGANLLAAAGLGVLACVPCGGSLAAPGVTVGANGTVCYCWPLVRVPVSLAGSLALLLHPALFREDAADELASYGAGMILKAVRWALGAANATYYTAGRARPTWWVV